MYLQVSLCIANSLKSLGGAGLGEFFHAVNSGSNPLGDTKRNQWLTVYHAVSPFSCTPHYTPHAQSKWVVDEGKLWCRRYSGVILFFTAGNVIQGDGVPRRPVILPHAPAPLCTCGRHEHRLPPPT